ncbi:hypothetical protein [Tessaracoccus massiliensis]|uniref:hypothetical protein n=1 Tax=Tessaracoccus massiliensis TaxID=1522311 RepID=UPI0006946D1C|nr:hypothetical protein [Tessaracoccus massiliensis]
MSWHLAPSLVRLRSEINARWPNRDKRSDGTIGDAAHSARKSDHNPNSRGSVNAFDLDEDGPDMKLVLNRLIGDPRVNYVIYERIIYSRSRNWIPRAYTGSNPHDKHLHVSILQTRTAEQDTRPWGIASAVSSAPKPTPKPAPAPTTGGLTMSDAAAIKSDTEYIRNQLRAIADGTYSRAALNARNADIATIVKAATDAQSRVLLDAFGKLGVSTVDLNALKGEVRKAVADAMDGAVIEIKAGQ